ncbi:MAG TPA: IPT/TIG domain-containing protein [Geobacteraceae bacterium]
MPLRFIITCTAVFLLAASASIGTAAPPDPSQVASPAPAITILSIIPAQGEPSTSVTLSGSGFSDKTTAHLGSTEVPTQVLSPKLLTFDIPNLAPGLYALFLRRADGVISRTYNFNLLPAKPEIYGVSPDTIYSCSADPDRQVVITGKNFLLSSQVLFDGAAIRGSFVSAETFTFAVPRIAAGLHQVQVKNAAGTVSGAQGLPIDGRPEIDSIVPGEEYVNSYNMMIGGRNFQQDITVVITEERDMGQTGIQQPLYDVKRLRSGTANATEKERAIFVNCSKIIYQRYPYSTTPKNFRVQVVNPDGEESSVIQVSAP